LEGENKGPPILAADIEEALIGVESIGGQTNRWPGVRLLELSGEADERLPLTILFVTRLSSFFTLTGPEHAVHAAIQAAARYFNDGVGSSLPKSLPFICLAEEL